MKPNYTIVPATELFATEIGISGAPLPTNGPGIKSPFLKYLIVGGIIVFGVVAAYQLHKANTPKIIPRNNENSRNQD
jgi:hypothetical protein